MAYVSLAVQLEGEVMKTAELRKPVMSEQELDLGREGVVLVVDPDQAERAGAFLEDAISFEDAWRANAAEGEEEI
jgi:hypothetical protein